MTEPLTGIRATFAVQRWGDARRHFGQALPFSTKAEQLRALLHETPHAGYQLESRGQDSAGVQFWIDVPSVWALGVRDQRAGEAIDEVVAALGALVKARHPGVAPAIEERLLEWTSWAVAAPGDVPEAVAIGVEQSSYDDDAFAESLVPRRAVIVGARLPGADGSCPGAMLRLAVGPDRFGLRVEGRSNARTRGHVPMPSEPMTFGIWSVLQALERCVEDFEERLRDHVSDVHAAVADPDPRAVQSLLTMNGKLLAYRSRLARRAVRLLGVLTSLPAHTLDVAISVEDREVARLRDFVARLDADRDEIVEAPQFLVAASSLRLAARADEQARHTTFLTRWAAALILPTLVVGALGANVLPWDENEPIALIGMLGMMLGSGLGGYFLVASPTTAAAEHWSRLHWVALAVLIFALGLVGLLAGTSQ